MRSKPVAICAALTLALTACGSQEDQPAVPPEGGSAATAANAGSRRSSEDSVAAVLQSQAPAPATLRFTLPQRAIVGEPIPLQLLVSAPQPVERLQLTVESADLQATPDSAALVLESANEAATHELTLTGNQAGLAEITVRLSTDDGKSEAVYAIPVMVGTAP